MYLLQHGIGFALDTFVLEFCCHTVQEVQSSDMASGSGTPSLSLPSSSAADAAAKAPPVSMPAGMMSSGAPVGAMSPMSTPPRPQTPPMIRPPRNGAPPVRSAARTCALNLQVMTFLLGGKRTSNQDRW